MADPVLSSLPVLPAPTSEQHAVISRELDITREVCPMTFVRVRLALDQLQSGQLLLVRLKGTEPLSNVPHTATDQGHQVLSLTAEADGTHLLLIRRG